MLDGLRQALEESVHQRPPLPAAVGRQGLEVDRIIRDGLLTLAEMQQIAPGLQAGSGAVEYPLHLRHELPRSSQARPTRVPHRRSPASRSPGQLGDDVRDACSVGREGLGLKLEDQLALSKECPTASRRSLVPLRGGELRFPNPGSLRPVRAAPRTGVPRDWSALGNRSGAGCLESGRQCGDLVGYGLYTLHECQQLLLLVLQQSLLLPQPVVELGLVCWLHLGQSVLLRFPVEPNAEPGMFQSRSRLFDKKGQ